MCTVVRASAFYGWKCEGDHFRERICMSVSMNEIMKSNEKDIRTRLA